MMVFFIAPTLQMKIAITAILPFFETPTLMDQHQKI
jgi:hypothetical protein